MIDHLRSIAADTDPALLREAAKRMHDQVIKGDKSNATKRTDIAKRLDSVQRQLNRLADAIQHSNDEPPKCLDGADGALGA